MSIAVNALILIVQTWQTAGWRLTDIEIELTFEAFNKFIAATVNVAGVNLPKRHMSAHLVRESLFIGNLRFYANWQDETLNRVWKACCRNISQLTFDTCVISSMQMVLRKTFSIR